MFPASFEYLRAHSIEEAFAALLERGAEARILAGGQSLIPAMRYRLARPTMLVDINPISELAYIREAGGALLAGAGRARFAIETSPIVKDGHRLMSDARPSSPIQSCAKAAPSSAASVIAIRPVTGQSWRLPRARKSSCEGSAGIALFQSTNSGRLVHHGRRRRRDGA